MCGIAGMARFGGLAPDDEQAVTRMTAAQTHRGPDADGLYSNDQVSLGHRRLSIIDVSSAAKQPMSNEDGSVWLTYNGEIYNHKELQCELLSRGHRFRSQSDTEVIVHGYEEWGIDRLLEKLRGMFAFGLHDSKRGLILARDRLGIKPLYYFAEPRALLFASEVKSLLASGLVPNERDPQALAGFLMGGSVPSPLTIIRDVRSLPAGHYLEWNRGRAQLQKYWDLRFDPVDGGNDPSGVLRSQLEDTVVRHLVSDVPLGVFLSGGVDSAALVALASRVRSSELRTLTVVFCEKEMSEGDVARKIARQFGTSHQEVLVTEEDFRRDVPRLLAAMDQPTNDGVNTYYVSKAARQAGLTVALSGLGADEVFWGYRHYRTLSRSLPWLQRCPGPARKMLASSAILLGRVRGKEAWGRLGYLRRNASPMEAYLSVRGFFAPRQIMSILGIGQKEFDANAAKHFDLTHSSDLNGFNYLEVKRYMHDQLLRDTDTFSMANSIEVRVPFLDHKVVEHAARVRPSMKLANGINKPLLVHAVNDPLLFEAGARKKRGFSFPMAHWMNGYANELEAMSENAEGIDRLATRRLWQNFRHGRLHWSRAWALAVLGAKN